MNGHNVLVEIKFYLSKEQISLYLTVLKQYWPRRDKTCLRGFRQNEIQTRLLRERSGSVVECFTRDQRAASSSLTGITALCP